MLTFRSARALQTFPSVPGRSSRRIVNSLLTGMVRTSLSICSGKSRGVLRGGTSKNATPVCGWLQGFALDHFRIGGTSVCNTYGTYHALPVPWSLATDGGTTAPGLLFSADDWT